MQRGEDPGVSGPVIEQLPIATPVAGYVALRDAGGPVDVELVAAAAFDEYADRLRAFVISATRNGDVADDVVQETFLRFVVELRASRRPDNVGGWLYRVASNLIISRGRRKSIVDRLKQVLPIHPGGPSAEDLALSNERDRTLAIALSRLPADARVALLLAARGMGPTEIALVIHRTPAATRTYLCRSRVRLRDALAALGVDARE
jgi:RNA polymerase sigma factor (sigma-70 family)